MRKTVLTIATAASLVFATAGAFAAELKVYVSGAMAHALEEISKDWVKKNGHTLDFVVGTTGVLQDRVRKGEKADVIEVTSVGMDQLEKEKLVVPGTRVEIARANIGVAVREGQPAIDISTPDALKQRLLAARVDRLYRPRRRRPGGCGDGEPAAEARHHRADEEQDRTRTDRRGIGAEDGRGRGRYRDLVHQRDPADQGREAGGAAAGGGAEPVELCGRDRCRRAPIRRQRARCLAAMQGADAHHVMVDAGLEPIGH